MVTGEKPEEILTGRQRFPNETAHREERAKPCISLLTCLHAQMHTVMNAEILSLDDTHRRIKRHRVNRRTLRPRNRTRSTKSDLVNFHIYRLEGIIFVETSTDLNKSQSTAHFTAAAGTIIT